MHGGNRPSRGPGGRRLPRPYEREQDPVHGDLEPPPPRPGHGGRLAADNLDGLPEPTVPHESPVRDPGEGRDRVDRRVQDDLRPQLRAHVARAAGGDADVVEAAPKPDEVRLIDALPRTDDGVADPRVPDLPGPEERGPVGRRARAGSLRGTSD